MVKILGGACVLVAVTVALSACGGSHRGVVQTSTGPKGTPVSTTTLRSSRLVLGGRVRCTATVTPSVAAGDAIDVTFALHNVSGSAVRAPVENASPWLVVRTADGTTYNTDTALQAEGSLGGPYRADRDPGRSDADDARSGCPRALEGTAANHPGP